MWRRIKKGMHCLLKPDAVPTIFENQLNVQKRHHENVIVPEYVETTDEVPEEGISPSEEDISPSEEGVSPSEEGVSPSEEGVSPSEEEVSSSEEEVSPSEEGISPSEEEVFPFEKGVSPSKEEVTPSENSKNEESDYARANGDMQTDGKKEADYYKDLYRRTEKRMRAVQSKLVFARRKIKRLEREVCTNKLKASIGTVFNEDQFRLLCMETKKRHLWCNDTLMKAFRLKFACGSSGYGELLKQNIPLPPERTLSRKIQSLRFKSGILDEIFVFLKIKIERFVNDIDKDCVLILDEMSITAGLFYDISSNTFLGSVTLPQHTGVTAHGLVFMLARISARWKQTIAYYFIENSVKGEVNKTYYRKNYKKIYHYWFKCMHSYL